MNGSKPRIAVFLDLENLIRGESAMFLSAMLAELAARATIVTLLGCTNAPARKRLTFAFPQVRMFTHEGGPDAADHRLLDMIRTQMPQSVDTVVIGSGDGIFAHVARELRARGLRVECVARAGSMSGRLYRAVDECHLIDDPLPASA